MTVESRPGSLGAMPDDRLGTASVSLTVAELRWTPDVAPAVMDRISRDAVAYPEQFDRRPQGAPPPMAPTRNERSAGRTIGRLAVFGVILIIIVGLVVLAATASASTAALALCPTVLRLGFRPEDGNTPRVVTEAP